MGWWKVLGESSAKVVPGGYTSASMFADVLAGPCQLEITTSSVSGVCEERGK